MKLLLFLPWSAQEETSARLSTNLDYTRPWIDLLRVMSIRGKQSSISIDNIKYLNDFIRADNH